MNADKIANAAQAPIPDPSDGPSGESGPAVAEGQPPAGPDTAETAGPGGATAVGSVPALALHHAPLVAGAALYRWDLRTDELTWSDNACALLAIRDPDLIKTGRAYAALLDSDNITNRYDAILASRTADSGEGVPYQITYQICPEGRGGAVRAWVEDSGSWFGRSDGRPEVALGMVRRIDQRYRQEERLHFLARYDALTSHLNRAGLAEALEQAVAASDSNGRSCAFLLAGIDRLAMINESYGFDVADDLIAQVGRRLQSGLRAGDTIGRYAGNKIGIILVNTPEEAMEPAAMRILEAVQESAIPTDAGSIPVTVSMGGVAIPRHARTAREAMMRAEEALGHARARPIGGFYAFNHSDQRENVRRRNIRIADEIVAALNEQRFAVAYQPIVALPGGAPAMYECLLRLIRPNKEVVSAGMFIETAEELGLARFLDHRVLELVLDALRRSPHATLTLNVSALTAMSPDWLDCLEQELAGQRELASRLVVEITETVAIKDVEASSLFVSAVKDIGCRVAIDDFGAGYTSFRNLKMLDIDMVKIDGSFIQNLSQSPGDQLFVRALIDLARNFNLPIVAEWVTSARDADLLQSWGVEYFQGFYFGEASLTEPWSGQKTKSRAAVG